MFAIDWRNLRLPPPPGIFIVRWISKKVLGNRKVKLPFQWWISKRELMDEGELKGFIRGESGFFEGLIPLFLAAGCLHDNKEVIGRENARAFYQMVKNGAKGSILADHKGLADIFLIQIALAVKCGLWELATKLLLPVLGMMYASRYPFESLLMRAANFVVAVPPKMEVPRSAKPMAREIWETLKTVFPSGLNLGFIGLIFAEGTRSREGKMLIASSGMTDLLKHPGSIYLPTALEGPEKILPPADERGIPLPIFTQSTKVIFGKPLTFEEVDARAKQLQRDFRIGYRQAFIDVIYRAIALLHIENKGENYAGYYAKPLEEIYVAR